MLLIVSFTCGTRDVKKYMKALEMERLALTEG